jgi:hypothetical protein
MDWSRTSIAVKMGNANYPKGVKTIIYNNIVKDPTKEQIDMFVEGLLLLSDGDSHLGTQVIKRDELSVD